RMTRGVDTCVWCEKPKENDDHVFPRALGGTRELTVPACRECQTAISIVEGEVTQRSELALFRYERGPTPTHKRRPESGAVEASYAFVRQDWLGGYADVALRAGEHPITLPSIEIDLQSGASRVRGVKPEDVDRLVDAALRVVTGTPNSSGV